eukprot:SM000144S00696  [mRNA]  locus=s144:238522:240584:+ [translate_table: standard]
MSSIHLNSLHVRKFRQSASCDFVQEQEEQKGVALLLRLHVTYDDSMADNTFVNIVVTRGQNFILRWLRKCVVSVQRYQRPVYGYPDQGAGRVPNGLRLPAEGNCRHCLWSQRLVFVTDGFQPLVRNQRWRLCDAAPLPMTRVCYKAKPTSTSHAQPF